MSESKRKNRNYCSVPNCPSPINKSYFLFPKNEETKQKWINAIKTKSLVCEEHFNLTDFHHPIKSEFITYKRKLLIKGVIPSLKLNQTSNSNKHFLEEHDYCMNKKMKLSFKDNYTQTNFTSSEVGIQASSPTKSVKTQVEPNNKSVGIITQEPFEIKNNSSVQSVGIQSEHLNKSIGVQTKFRVKYSSTDRLQKKLNLLQKK